MGWRRQEDLGNQVKPTTTFYVGNLPGGVSNSLLRKAFMPHGVVKDAYVARKRDARGNFFGFVRLEGVSNIDYVLEGMNKVTIYEAKLTVFPAKFDKHNRRFEHNGPTMKYVPVRTQPQTIPLRQPNRFYTGTGISFRDAVAKTPEQEKTTKGDDGVGKKMEYKGKIAVYPDHCMMRSVIVEAVNLEAFSLIRGMLDNGGYRDTAISYVGGLKCMLVFKEKREAVGFIRDKVDMWSSIFSSTKLWEGQNLDYDRVAWICIRGSPIQVRDDKFFNEVGSLFGKVLRGSDFSWGLPENHESKCCVLTSSGKRIDEEVCVTWEDRTFSIWVTEVIDETFSSVLKDLNVTCSSPKPNSCESVAAENDGPEEGEFRPDLRGSSENRPENIGGDNGEEIETSPENEEPGVGRKTNSLHGIA
ncbi:putative RNA recognition motif domain, nucleotide-binding alpha-beta plait domain superfamily [Helianthus annuus]|nr:putative RNA recognition motif domain, nucleotide-binding alpha-beta plait domain superfamily [Helianthus annuus]